MVVTGQTAAIGIPATTFEPSGAETGAAGGTLSGAAAGAIGGALIAGPVGAAIGGAAGAVGGAVTGAVTGELVEPTPEVTTFVTSNQVQPVFLEGEVVVGAVVPETVVLTPVPNYAYSYAYVNGQTVLVDPGTRAIVYVVR
jgi:hypothetical protein